MKLRLSFAVLILAGFVTAQKASAQSYGIELHNNVMPASGALGGTSLSRPQDIQSAINGNPATMTQFRGPTFGFGGSIVEPTYNVRQTASLPLTGVTPYEGKSSAPASLLGNFGAIHQAEAAGIPFTMGLGFIANAGLAADFRHLNESNGTHASYVALDLIAAGAVELTTGLTLGGSFALGTSFLDGPFVESSSQQTDYGTRFKVGANYDFGNGISVGGFWESEKAFTFENAVRFVSGPSAGVFQDMNLEHPANFGFGIANRCLMNGRLLLAADVLHKNWDDAQFFGAIYESQWAASFGGQYTLSPKLKLRMGYAVNEDATRDVVPGAIGGIIPVGGIPTVQYVQGQFAAISQHRLTGGIGVNNMIPNTNFDFTVGGVFENEKSFGATTAQLDGYFIAFGFTFVRPNCCQ